MNPIRVNAASSDGQTDSSMEVIDISTTQEELTFEENGVDVKMVFTRYYGAIAKIDIYRDSIYDESIILRDKAECEILSFVNIRERAYENRRFSANQLVYSSNGNTTADSLTQTGVIAALSAVIGMVYLPAAAISSLAASIINTYLSIGHSTSDMVNINYTVYKYWANTIDGIDPVIYRTTFQYYFVNGISRTNEMFTYNNPI